MNKALLIIDVQNDYFPGGRWELYQSEAALKVIKQLLEFYRANDFPIYFIQHISAHGSKFFEPETKGVEIHDDIKPLDKEKVIIKHHPNSFLETDLKLELQGKSIDELVICGMMTHMCVDTTVRAAKDLGYHITLISDACTTRELEWKGNRISASIVHDVYLASLDKIFADVMTAEEWLPK